MAVLQLKQNSTYWAGLLGIEDLAARIMTEGRALQQRERRILQALPDMGYADCCVPDTGKVRTPLDVRRDTTAVQARCCTRLPCRRKLKTGGVGLLNLLQFSKDTAHQTHRVLRLLVNENIHYRKLRLLYGAKNQHGTCVPTCGMYL